MRKMILLAVFAALASIALFMESSEGFGECAQDCESCHSIVRSEASCILDCADLRDDNIKDITMVRSAGLWKVEVEKDGNSSTYFIDFGKKNVFVGEMRSAEQHAEHSDPEWSGNDIRTLSDQSRELTDSLLQPASGDTKQ